MVNIIVPVFDLDSSFGIAMFGKSPENVWKRSWKYLEINLQNCVGTFRASSFMY